ncbi:MAG: phosphoribosylformylglycinamidine synthase subunit PurQ [Sumerlaeia bacterium]
MSAVATDRVKFAVVVFPGSNCDRDCLNAVKGPLGQHVQAVWHRDAVPDDVDCIIVPGGFSYGDALRAGALAALSPVMESVRRAADDGKLVLGVCNGFQVLLESGLLPGALMKNTGLRFVCRDVFLRVDNWMSPFTLDYGPNQVIRVPVAHGYGNYYAPQADLDALEERGGVVFRYCDEHGNLDSGANPNGSLNAIAGITNERGNVLGMMPHPERACEGILGSRDGLKLFESMVKRVVALRG